MESEFAIRSTWLIREGPVVEFLSVCYKVMHLPSFEDLLGCPLVGKRSMGADGEPWV